MALHEDGAHQGAVVAAERFLRSRARTVLFMGRALTWREYQQSLRDDYGWPIWMPDQHCEVCRGSGVNLAWLGFVVEMDVLEYARESLDCLRCGPDPVPIKMSE